MGLSLQCREVLKGRVPGVTRGYHGVLEVTLDYRELPGSNRGDQEYYSGSGSYQRGLRRIPGGTRRIPEVYQGEPGFTTGQVLPWGAPNVTQGGNEGCHGDHGVPRVTRSLK
jgi:hypothetical protein